MNIKEAIKIINCETSSGEDLQKARKFLIDKGAMRINGKNYEIQAKHDPFLEKFLSEEKWVFAGLTSPFDGI